MNVLSLFDGMSCGQIALNRCGIDYDNYFASEIDINAIKIAQHNFPRTVQLGDVKKIHYTNLGIEVDTGKYAARIIEVNIDLILSGSPCQGFSFAGKGLNFEDERSKLFFEFVRLLNQVRLIKPKVLFLFENVKMKREHEVIISKILKVRPIRFNSSLVSAQNRERLYWTNIPVNTVPKNKKISLNEILEPGYYADRNKSYCIDANYGKGTNFRRYYFCSSRQLVLQKGYAPKNLTKETANEIMHRDGNKWRKLSVIECERLQTVPEFYTSCVSKANAYHALGNGWTVDIIAHIFKHIKNEKTIY